MSELAMPNDGQELEIVKLPPLEIPKKKLELVKFQTLQEQDNYMPDIGYAPALFSQVSLPYKDPKNEEVWIRRNGDVTLKVTPHTVQDPETGAIERRYPYGIMPRLIIAYLTTEAARQGSRDVELGKTLTEFMRNIGMRRNGQNMSRVKDHMQRFFGANVTFDGSVVRGNGRAHATVYFKFADSVTMFADSPSSGAGMADIIQKGQWESSVRLSEQFYNEIANRKVPLDLNAIRLLGSSPMNFDVYLWLAHKMNDLNAPTRITWGNLNQQFGSRFKEIRQFKAQFLKSLAAVTEVYKDLNFDIETNYIVLKPSSTPIRQIARRPMRIADPGQGPKFLGTSDTII